MEDKNILVERKALVDSVEIKVPIWFCSNNAKKDGKDDTSMAVFSLQLNVT